MANRGITGNLFFEVDNNSVEYYECVEIDINPGYYLTNAPKDITIGSQTYTAQLGSWLRESPRGCVPPARDTWGYYYS